MGGMIAQQMAIAHPERVRSLTSIMSTTGDPDVRGPSYETIVAVLAPFPADRAGYVRRRSSSGARCTAAAFRSTRSAVGAWPRARSTARSIPAACGASSSPSGCRATAPRALQKLTVPTLVIHGDADPLIPVDGGRATARAIAGARLEIIPAWATSCRARSFRASSTA